MATGRTSPRWTRIYIDGYDMSGYTSQIGPLMWEYEESEMKAFLDSVKGALPDKPEIGIGTLTGIFDNTANSGIHAVLASAGVARDVLVAIGIRANPAEGDPAFMGPFNELGYQHAPSGANHALTIPFGKASPAEGMLYDQPWGTLLHENAAETDANTSTGVDDKGASSAKGGFMMYQILDVEGSGTVEIKVQEASTNSNLSFGDLSGATSGAISDADVPCAGIVQLGKSASIKRYLRWQMDLDTITSCTFLLGFVRGR